MLSCKRALGCEVDMPKAHLRILPLARRKLLGPGGMTGTRIRPCTEEEEAYIFSSAGAEYLGRGELPQPPGRAWKQENSIQLLVNPDGGGD